MGNSDAASYCWYMGTLVSTVWESPCASVGTVVSCPSGSVVNSWEYNPTKCGGDSFILTCLPASTAITLIPSVKWTVTQIKPTDFVMCPEGTIVTERCIGGSKVTNKCAGNSMGTLTCTYFNYPQSVFPCKDSSYVYNAVGIPTAGGYASLPAPYMNDPLTTPTLVATSKSQSNLYTVTVDGGATRILRSTVPLLYLTRPLNYAQVTEYVTWNNVPTATTALAVTDAGDLLAVGDSTGQVRLYTTSSGAEGANVQPASCEVRSLRFSSDGATLYIAYVGAVISVSVPVLGSSTAVLGTIANVCVSLPPVSKQSVSPMSIASYPTLYGPVCVEPTTNQGVLIVEQNALRVLQVTGGNVASISPMLAKPYGCIVLGGSGAKPLLFVTLDVCVVKLDVVSRAVSCAAGRCKFQGSSVVNAVTKNARFKALRGISISPNGYDAFVVDTTSGMVLAVTNVSEAVGMSLSITRTVSDMLSVDDPLSASITPSLTVFTQELVSDDQTDTSFSSRTRSVTKGLRTADDASVEGTPTNFVSPTKVSNVELSTPSVSQSRTTSLTNADTPLRSNHISSTLSLDRVRTWTKTHTKTRVFSSQAYDAASADITQSRNSLSVDRFVSLSISLSLDHPPSHSILSLTNGLNEFSEEPPSPTATFTRTNNFDPTVSLTSSPDSPFSFSATVGTKTHLVSVIEEPTPSTSDSELFEATSETPIEEQTNEVTDPNTGTLSRSVSRLDLTADNVSMSQLFSQTIDEGIRPSLWVETTTPISLEMSLTSTQSISDSRWSPCLRVNRDQSKFDSRTLQDKFFDRPIVTFSLVKGAFDVTYLPLFVQSFRSLKSDNLFSGQARDDILKSSQVVNYTETSVTISFGYSVDYDPIEDDVWWVAPNTGSRVLKTNNLLSSYELPPCEDGAVLQIVTPAIASPVFRKTFQAATAVTGIIGLANPAALQGMQKFALLAALPCLDPNMRDMSEQAQWSLSPLYAAFGKIITTASQSLNMVIWNVSFVLVFLLLHSLAVHVVSHFQGKVYEEAAEATMFPAGSLTVFTLMIQGTAQQALLAFFKDSHSAFFAILAFALLTIPVGSIGYVVRYVMKYHQGKYIPYPIVKQSKGLFKKVVLPRGVWLPESETTRYGVIYAMYTRSNKWFHILVLSVLTFQGIVTGIDSPTEAACRAQMVLVAVGEGIMVLFFVARLPHRSVLQSMFSAVSQSIQGTLIIIIVVVPQPGPNTTALSNALTMIMTIALFCGGVHSVFLMWWEGKARSSIQNEIFQNQVDQTEDLEFEMSLNVGPSQSDAELMGSMMASNPRERGSTVMIDDIQLTAEAVEFRMKPQAPSMFGNNPTTTEVVAPKKKKIQPKEETQLQSVETSISEGGRRGERGHDIIDDDNDEPASLKVSFIPKVSEFTFLSTDASMQQPKHPQQQQPTKKPLPTLPNTTKVAASTTSSKSPRPPSLNDADKFAEYVLSAPSPKPPSGRVQKGGGTGGIPSLPPVGSSSKAKGGTHTTNKPSASSQNFTDDISFL